MVLRERPHGTTVVIDIEGPVDRESGATTQFVLAVNRLVHSGRYTAILLNVRALGEVDSVLLGAITQAHTTSVRAGVSLKLLNVAPPLHDLLVLTRLNQFIEVATSEQAEIDARK